MGTPHKCPKCDGYGKLLYDPDNPFGGGTVAGPWHCNPCGGTGIIWSTDPVVVCKPFREEHFAGQHPEDRGFAGNPNTTKPENH